MINRFVLIGIIFVLIDVYAFFAFRGLSRQMSEGVQRSVIFIYWGISLLAYLIYIATMVGWIDNQTKFLQVYGRTFMIILMVTKLFMIPFLLIDDVRRLGIIITNYFSQEPRYDAGRSRFLSTVAVVAGLAPGIAMLFGSLKNAYNYKVKRLKIPIDGLHPDLEGFKIVQISDIHTGSFYFEHPIEHGIDLIRKEMGDLIVFTGDLVNYKADEADPYIPVFKRINIDTQMTYSILGNHDYGDYVKWDSPQEKIANLESLKHKHSELGWDLLLNEHRVIQHKGARIGIIGVENFSALPQFPKYGNLQKAIENIPPVDFKLLLSHDPTHWDYEVNKSYKDIVLMLAGHTHGFQFGINIPGWIKWSPAQFIFRQWAGLYQKAGQYLYVNTGFGFLAYAGRVGFMPEITVLTLTSGK